MAVACERKWIRITFLGKPWNKLIKKKCFFITSKKYFYWPNNYRGFTSFSILIVSNFNLKKMQTISFVFCFVLFCFDTILVHVLLLLCCKIGSSVRVHGKICAQIWICAQIKMWQWCLPLSMTNVLHTGPTIKTNVRVPEIYYY